MSGVSSCLLTLLPRHYLIRSAKSEFQIVYDNWMVTFCIAAPPRRTDACSRRATLSRSGGGGGDDRRTRQQHRTRDNKWLIADNNASDWWTDWEYSWVKAHLHSKKAESHSVRQTDGLCTTRWSQGRRRWWWAALPNLVKDKLAQFCSRARQRLKKCDEWNYKSMNSFTIDLSLIMLCDRLAFFRTVRPSPQHQLAANTLDSIASQHRHHPSIRPSIKCNLRQPPTSHPPPPPPPPPWCVSTTTTMRCCVLAQLFGQRTLPPCHSWFDFESNREAAKPLT